MCIPSLPQWTGTSNLSWHFLRHLGRKVGQSNTPGVCLCVHVLVFVCACVGVCVYMCWYLCEHVWVFVCTCVGLCVHQEFDINSWCACMCVYVCMCVCMSVCEYVFGNWRIECQVPVQAVLEPRESCPLLYQAYWFYPSKLVGIVCGVLINQRAATNCWSSGNFPFLTTCFDPFLACWCSLLETGQDHTHSYIFSWRGPGSSH